MHFIIIYIFFYACAANFCLTWLIFCWSACSVGYQPDVYKRQVIYAAIIDGKFVNRGFLNGPICPIYGFGVLFVLTLLEPIRENFLFLFIGSVILTSVLEFITGFLLEKVFKMKWWDYSNERFNIHGYICLKFSIIWGLACLIVVDIIHPFFMKAVEINPINIGIITIGILSVLFISDIISTIIGINRTNRYLKLLSKSGSQLRKISESIGENISDKTIQFTQKSENIKNDVKEKRQKAINDMEKHRAAIQRKQEDILKNMPMTAKRIRSAFPDLKLFEYWDNKNKENKK